MSRFCSSKTFMCKSKTTDRLPKTTTS